MVIADNKVQSLARRVCLVPRAPNPRPRNPEGAGSLRPLRAGQANRKQNVAKPKACFGALLMGTHGQAPAVVEKPAATDTHRHGPIVILADSNEG
jgi:hypothetical protein